ncbi:transposase [Lachnotalea glycerini]|uniref:Transposase n=1 Tax=Lachnotalea glycerini TaxID=1763509 RepID=A0A318EPJ3_9FIRM|nr:IS21 family transposase [Lachnotalea glycerini]PXV88419.1 transposase [Lachnotalea glycerini]
MKDLQDWAAVQKLRKKNKKVAVIAKELGMSRTTVYKLLTMDEEPIYSRIVYLCKVDFYAEQIIEWRFNPDYDFNGTRIFRELKKLGYKGSITPVYTFLNRISETSYSGNRKATMRIETPVGDQAQFDWSPYEMWIGTRKREVYCFTMIFAASRKKAIVFSLKSDADAIYEAIQELFEDLGGVTLELLIDNPKSLVIENDPKTEDEITYNPKALLVAKHLGTELNACNCYWPRTKGKIEKPYQYIEEQFVKGNRFTDMEQLNREAKDFMNKWCNEVHGTTKRVPNLHYEQEEKAALLPLPSHRLYLDTNLDKRVVSPDSYISIHTNKYSLPVKYAGMKVQFRIIYGFRIQVYSMEKDFIQTLWVQDDKYQTKTQDEHFTDIRIVTKSIPQIKREFTERFQNGQRYLEELAKVTQQPSHHARKILQMCDTFNFEDLDILLLHAIKQNKLEIREFKKMVKEQGYELLHKKTSPLQQELKKQSDAGLTRDCSYYETAQETINL